jgi:hypothetical protein
LTAVTNLGPRTAPRSLDTALKLSATRSPASIGTPARAAPPILDLGPGRGDGSARPAPHRDWARHLVLRPAQPVAARHQREHQRPAPPVLPQGHRSRTTLPR